jgi:hypothetical protein
MPEERVPPARPDLFSWAHGGCGAFLVLLLVAMVLSLFYGMAQTLWPTRTAVGALGPVEEIRSSGGRALYQATLENETGERLTLRLRNHGRILTYLREQTAGQSVSVRYGRGEIWELAPLSPEAPAVREFPSAWPGLLLLLSGGGLLLYFLGRPWLAVLPLSRFRVQEL